MSRLTGQAYKSPKSISFSLNSTSFAGSFYTPQLAPSLTVVPYQSSNISTARPGPGQVPPAFAYRSMIRSQRSLPIFLLSRLRNDLRWTRPLRGTCRSWRGRVKGGCRRQNSTPRRTSSFVENLLALVHEPLDLVVDGAEVERSQLGFVESDTGRVTGSLKAWSRKVRGTF